MSLNISNQLIVDEAILRGWSVECVDEANSAFVILHNLEGRKFVIKSTITELASAIGYNAADDKKATYDLLSRCGLPLPATELYSDEATAQRFLALHGRIVVKPTDQSHGNGVSTNITTDRALAQAVMSARIHSDFVMLQAQCPGKDHRILVIDGKMKAAAYRRQPFVVGDGISTIAQLIEAKNSHPHRGEGYKAPLTRIDPVLATEYLGGGEALARVPANGETVELLGTANTGKGGEAVDVTDIVHPEIVRIAVEAAAELELGIAGIDIMTEDITKSPQESPAYIIEVNASPGLRMHHFPTQGTPRNIAAEVLDALERRPPILYRHNG